MRTTPIRYWTLVWMLIAAPPLPAAEPIVERPPTPSNGGKPVGTNVDPTIPTAPLPYTPGVQNTNSGAWNIPPGFQSPGWGQDSLAGVDLTTLPPHVFTRGGTQGAIVLRVAADAPEPVAYQLFGLGQNWRYQLTKGQRQQFLEDRVWGIRLQRNDANEFVNYRLLEGEYEFDRTDRGWELFLVKAGPMLPPPPPRRSAMASDGGATPPPPPVNE